MSQLSVVLQGSVERESEARTILGFLRERMDGLDTGRRRRTLKERLGFKGMNCCGPAWGFRPTTISVRDDDEEEEQAARREQNEGLTEVRPDAGQHPTVDGFDPVCLDPDPVPVSSGMNLAAALAAERHYRASHEPEGTALGPNSINEPTRSSPGTPLRMSLLRLLEEAEGGDGGEKRGKETEARGGGGGALGNDSVCCVCMGRKKGAAFIPCGHTFCRVCSRELWLNRGSCPLCNRPILEILDIF